MKKGIKKEIDFSLDKDMQDILERNYLESRKAWEKQKEKEETEKLLTTIIIGFIIAATTMILMLNSKLTQDAKESCMSLGHSESYCMAKI